MTYDARGWTDYDDDPHGAEPSARRPYATWGNDIRGAWRASDEGPADDPDPSPWEEAQMERRAERDAR